MESNNFRIQSNKQLQNQTNQVESSSYQKHYNGNERLPYLSENNLQQNNIKNINNQEKFPIIDHLSQKSKTFIDFHVKPQQTQERQQSVQYNRNNNEYDKNQNNDILQEYLFYNNERNQDVKSLLKNIIDNQNQLNLKYNNIVRTSSEQESLNKINSYKLNEMDNKLTELLIKFNNNLKINEITANKIANLEMKSQNFITVNEHKFLNDSFFTFKNILDSKIGDLHISNENLVQKNSHFASELEGYQKYAFDRFSKLSNEIVSNNSLLEDTFRQIENTWSKKTNDFHNVVYTKIKALEDNIEFEKEFRHNQLINMKKEFKDIYFETDTKIKEVEKNFLEFEKKFINFSKDYISEFNSLIKDYNIKLESEIEKNNSIQSSLLDKIDKDYKAEISQIKELIYISKSEIIKKETQIQEIESTIMNLKGNCDNNTEIINSNNLSSTILFEKLSQDLNQIRAKMVKNEDFKETTEKLSGRINNIDSTLMKQLLKFEVDNEKKLTDMKDSLNGIDNKNCEKIKALSENIDKLNKEHDIEAAIIDRKINLKADVFRTSLEEFKKKMVNIINSQMNETVEKYKEHENRLLKTLSLKLDQKNSVLKEELDLDKENYKLILEGKLQSKIIEMEKIINDSTEKKLKDMHDSLFKVQNRNN